LKTKKSGGEDMPFCGKCGTQVPEGTRFCGTCGNMITGGAPGQNEAMDAQENKWMGILAYLGPLVFVPMFAAKNSKFARFHTVQGFNLFLLDIAYGIVAGVLNAIFFAIFWGTGLIFSMLFSFISIAILVLAIIGIVNAAQGNKKELPIIGKLRILDSFMKPVV
jgi:uncharacterized membrane protein